MIVLLILTSLLGYATIGYISGVVCMREQFKSLDARTEQWKKDRAKWEVDRNRFDTWSTFRSAPDKPWGEVLAIGATWPFLGLGASIYFPGRWFLKTAAKGFSHTTDWLVHILP